MKDFKTLLIVLSLITGFIATPTGQAKSNELTQNNIQTVTLWVALKIN